MTKHVNKSKPKPKPRQKSNSNSKLRITLKDFVKANKRAARLEEIQSHGRPVEIWTITHKSKKAYDRNRLKRTPLTQDEG
ncbi:MAG: hypothetical protein MJY56_04460 [Bacteroidales bacterium]|nr:hypothetical protein [Bacteroidales bacterium]